MASKLRSLDSLCSEGASLDAATLVVSATGRRAVCISLPSSPAGVRRKASVVAPPATPEHYRAALLEEGHRIKWPGCLQPQCARWGAHLPPSQHVPLERPPLGLRLGLQVTEASDIWPGFLG